MPNLVLLRWHITKPGRPQYRAVEEIIVEVVHPAVKDVRTAGHAESLYVSKHGGYEIWFTVFVPTTHATDTIALVEPRLRCVCWVSNHVTDSSRDEMLRASCAAFRMCVDRMTSIALELHSSDLLKAQQALIRMGCKNRADRAALEPLLLAQSPTYVALADRDAFWQSFTSNCLSYSTDCGHWLYNIVLGLDSFHGQPEAEVAAALGLPWP